MDSIQPSLLIARQALAGRQRRFALLALAVSMAAALVTTLACAMATLHDNIARRVERLVGDAQVRVVHDSGGDVPAALLTDVARWSGVAQSEGVLVGSLLLSPSVRTSDTEAPRVTVRAYGRDLQPADDAKRFDLRSGRVLERSDEILLDPLAADTLGVTAGDRVEVQRWGDPIVLTVCGVYERPAIGALQRPVARLALDTLRAAEGSTDELTQVLITLADGVVPEAWLEENQSRVAAPLRLEPAESMISGLDRPRRAMSIGLAIVTMIGFLGCAFIVATGMTSAVAEQMREMAILRAIGASRVQVLASQLLVGCGVGAAGAALGVPLGIGIAALAASAFSEWLPIGLVVPWWVMPLSAGGSVATGLGGAAYPAIRAALAPPLESMRVRSRVPSRAGLVLSAFGGITLIAMATSPFALPGDREWTFWAWAFMGLPLVFTGWFLLCVPLLWFIAGPLDALWSALTRVPRGLLAGSLRASPYRFGMVAGALMVGVAILVITHTNGPAMLDNLTERVRFADAFICKTTGLSEAEQARVRAIPEMRNAVAVGYLPLRVQGYARADGSTGATILGLQDVSPPNVVAVGFPPREFMALNRLEWLAGSPEDALEPLERGEGVLVAPEFLRSRGLSVGDAIDLGPDGRSKRYHIVGVVGAAGLDVATQFFGIQSVYAEHAVSCVFLDGGEVARTFGSKEAFIMQVGLPKTFTDEAESVLERQVQNAAPGTVFVSGRRLRAFVLGIGDTVMTMLVGVGVAAILLATVGVSSVIAVGLRSRSQEWGVLRAVGAPLGLVPRIALGEAAAMVAVALFAGLALGEHLAWAERALFHSLAGLTLSPAWPGRALLIAGATLTILVVAAVLPTARAIARQPARELLQSLRGT